VFILSGIFMRRVLFLGILLVVLWVTLYSVSLHRARLNNAVLEERPWLRQHASRVVRLFGWDEGWLSSVPLSWFSSIALPDGVNRGVLDTDQFADVLGGKMPLYGGMAPDIVLVQLCSPYSRYCQEFYQAWLDKTYLDQFGPSFGMVSLPYPLLRSAQERQILQTFLCRGAQESGIQRRDWYREYMRTFIDDEVAGRDLMVSHPECQSLQWSFALQSTISMVDSLFSVQQLPLHIFINTRTKAFITLPGLFEMPVMWRAIEELLE
jgi:hypothetical protein